MNREEQRMNLYGAVYVASFNSGHLSCTQRENDALLAVDCFDLKFPVAEKVKRPQQDLRATYTDEEYAACPDLMKPMSHGKHKGLELGQIAFSHGHYLTYAIENWDEGHMKRSIQKVLDFLENGLETPDEITPDKVVGVPAHGTDAARELGNFFRGALQPGQDELDEIPF